MDLWSVVAHELGHVLGIAHTDEGYDPESVTTSMKFQIMYSLFGASAAPGCQVRRYLGAGDFSAVCSLDSC
jgi:hypothetical protein